MSTAEMQVDRVYRVVREKMGSNAYAPGMRLFEHEVAEQLGVSRATVRAAFARLAAEGLVCHIPHRGVRIPIIGPQELEEVVQVREAIECMMIRRAVEMATDAEIQSLGRIVGDMCKAVQEGDFHLYARLNGEFHRQIWVMARNRKASQILETLNLQVARCQFSGLMKPGRAKASLGEHKAILDAVVERDSDRAVQALRLHLSQVARAWREAGFF